MFVMSTLYLLFYLRSNSSSHPSSYFLPHRLLLSALDITQRSIDDSAPLSTTATATATAAPLDLLPLLRDALLQAVDGMGAVLAQLQRLPRHVREWEIHASVELGKQYFAGKPMDSSFSGAFGDGYNAFANANRDFVDPSRAAGAQEHARRVNAGVASGVAGTHAITI